MTVTANDALDSAVGTLRMEARWGGLAHITCSPEFWMEDVLAALADALEAGEVGEPYAAKIVAAVRRYA